MIKCENSCPLEKFEGCCACCPEKDGCSERCTEVPEECGTATFDEETALATSVPSSEIPSGAEIRGSDFEYLFNA